MFARAYERGSRRASWLASPLFHMVQATVALTGRTRAAKEMVHETG
jgi:hypothetical protein